MNFDKSLKIRKVEQAVEVNKADAIGNGYLKLIFCKYDSSIFFRIAYIRTKAIVIKKSDAFIFLLQGQDSVKAYPDGVFSGEKGANTARTQYVLTATYYFDVYDDIRKMKNKKVKTIRIYHNGVYDDQDIKDEFSEALLNTLKCF